MSPTLRLLQDLLPELGAYEQATASPTLSGFAAWLAQRQQPAPASAELPLHREPQYLNHLPPLMQLGPLVGRLNHFAHARAEQLLASLPVPGIREFSVLASVASGIAPTKSAIAAASLLELSTITEVTRRLVQAGLVAEVADPHDRRTRRLQITAEGRRVYDEARTRMEESTVYIFGLLGPADQHELLRLLSQLNAAHSDRLLPASIAEEISSPHPPAARGRRK